VDLVWLRELMREYVVKARMAAAFNSWIVKNA
jgi:hypothetical protein